MNLKQIEEEALHPSEKDETFAKFSFSVISGRAGIHRPRETRHDVPSGHSRGNPVGQSVASVRSFPRRRESMRLEIRRGRFCGNDGEERE